MIKIFSIGALVVLCYYGLLETLPTFGIQLSHRWNIPMFMFMGFSLPWVLPFTANYPGLMNFLGPAGLQIFMVIIVAFGFGINLTLVYYIGSKVAQRIRNRTNSV